LIAKTGKGNLLEIAVDAARNKTTQISDAFMEDTKHKLNLLVEFIARNKRR
jgi:hypothetical protein